MENINKENDALNDIINKIKQQSPVHIFNIDLENKQTIIGMYLMCNDNKILETKLKESAIMDNIKDNTLLFFDRRHAVEIASILYGAFSIIKKYIPDIKLDTYIMENFIKILMNYVSYKDLMHLYEYNLDIINIPDELKKRLLIILKYICFIPYGILDSMLEEAVKIYKKSQSESRNNNE